MGHGRQPCLVKIRRTNGKAFTAARHHIRRQPRHASLFPVKPTRRNRAGASTPVQEPGSKTLATQY